MMIRIMIILVFVAVMISMLASCGRVPDQIATETKGYSERRIDGVNYLFVYDTGVSVKYTSEGTIERC